MPPIVTVIVPSYRREAALCNMLSTLLAQDVDDFEILLIDQTPEHEQETIQFLSKHADRIQRYYQATPNLPLARNTGLSLAQGAIIFFVDDDVLLPTDCIRCLQKPLVDGELDGVSGLVSFEKNDEELWDEYRRSYGFPKLKPKTGVLPVNRFIGALMGFRREVFDLAGKFDERLGQISNAAAGEDYEMCRRVISSGFRLGLDPNVVIQHPLGIPGGCQNRVLSADITRNSQMRANFYIEMKEANSFGNLTFAGWIRMLRGYILNSGLLTIGHNNNLNSIIDVVNNYKMVKAFYLEGKTINSQITDK